MTTGFLPRTLVLFVLGSALSFNYATSAAEKAAIDTSKLPPALTKSGVTYGTDIKPIFEKSCVRCHGPEKPKAKLRLDSHEAALKGGESGKVIVPGKSVESPLVHNISHLGSDEDHFMPPPGNKAGIPKLTNQQIGLIRAWIDQGAK